MQTSSPFPQTRSLRRLLPLTIMSVTSPTFTAVSDDSFQHLALSSSSISHSRLDLDALSDDEIVWSVSEADLSSSASMISLASPYPPTSPADSEDEDFVVLSRNYPARAEEDARPSNASTPYLANQPLASEGPELSPETLARHMEDLAIDEGDGNTSQTEHNVQSKTPSPIGKKRRNRRKRNTSTPQPPPPPPSNAAHSSPSKQKSSKKKRKTSSAGLGAQPIVDDPSDVSSDVGSQKISEEYQSAVKFIDALVPLPILASRGTDDIELNGAQFPVGPRVTGQNFAAYAPAIHDH